MFLEGDCGMYSYRDGPDGGEEADALDHSQFEVLNKATTPTLGY